MANKSKIKHSLSNDRPSVNNLSTMRSRATVNRLKMYKNAGIVKRDRAGKVLRSAELQNSVKSGEVSRVAPNRKWFANSRVIEQDSLNKFVDEMSTAMKDPYKMVLKPGQLPISLLTHNKMINRDKTVHILDTEPFKETFGKKQLRTRPKLRVSSIEEYANISSANQQKFNDKLDSLTAPKSDILDENYVENEIESKAMFAGVGENDSKQKKKNSDPVFNYGQSRRIWNELYKVIDSSDVVFYVLDARNPIGTRCNMIEKFLKKEKPFKHFVFILNKSDLIPAWAVKSWCHKLSEEHPTIAFHANMKNSFGKKSVFSILRQFSILHKDKKNISVGIIGYPNVGKSSLINTLKSKKVCNVAPIPGETKTWQYITLLKKVFLIDCPGAVPPDPNNTEAELVLKGVVRVEYLSDPIGPVCKLLEIVQKDYLIKTYEIGDFDDAESFLANIARRMGKLLKGGEPDLNAVAKIVLADFQRGKIPFYTPPPLSKAEQAD